MDALSRVVIVGAGELGKAIGGLVGKKGIAVDFWDANPATVPGQKPLAEIVPLAGYVFFCVPSWAMREAVVGAVPYLPPQAVVFSFAKGIEKFSFQTMAEIVPALLPPTQPFVVVGGPMLAEEISVGKGAIGVFASRNAAALQGARDLFASDDFYVETTDDVEGVALAGVLKNIYAVALGIADGLELSGNQKGWLTSRAICEMRAIATALGVDPDTILGTAGVGDFVATGYSVHSRNRETGIEIVATGKCNIRGEGLNTLPFLIERLGEKKAAAFPLLMLVNTIGIKCSPARAAFEDFFKNSVASR
jgi:glycerol-3-phosphate dehydrogenase (NAD(P)+)